MTIEFLSLLDKSKGKHEVLETGYSVEKQKKKTKYAKSELRLIETRSVCHSDISHHLSVLSVTKQEKYF